MHKKETGTLETLVQGLCERGDIVLESEFGRPSENEINRIVDYLAGRYESEALNFPGNAPPFDRGAAKWAVEYLVVVLDFILVASNQNDEIIPKLPDYKGDIDGSAMLSADLCLRFFPDLITELQTIDKKEILLPKLDEMLRNWHYSYIPFLNESVNMKFDNLFADLCFRDLYISRIIEYKNLNLARHPDCAPWVEGHLGFYSAEFWPGYQTFEEHDNTAKTE